MCARYDNHKDLYPFNPWMVFVWSCNCFGWVHVLSDYSPLSLSFPAFSEPPTNVATAAAAAAAVACLLLLSLLLEEEEEEEEDLNRRITCLTEEDLSSNPFLKKRFLHKIIPFSSPDRGRSFKRIFLLLILQRCLPTTCHVFYFHFGVCVCVWRKWEQEMRISGIQLSSHF